MLNRKKDQYARVLVGSGRDSVFINVKKGEKVLIGSGSSSMIIRAGKLYQLMKNWKSVSQQDQNRK